MELQTSDDLQARAWGLTAHASGMLQPAEQADRARLAHEASVTAMQWSGTDDDFVYHWVVCLEAAVAAGDTDRIRDALDLVESRPPGLITPYVHAELFRLRGLANLETGDPDAVEIDLRAALDELDAFGVPFPRAQAQLALAELLIRRDRIDEAMELLARARQTFEALEATPWVVRTTDRQEHLGLAGRQSAATAVTGGVAADSRG